MNSTHTDNWAAPKKTGDLYCLTMSDIYVGKNSSAYDGEKDVTYDARH
jgi:hypothetical protein